jgi:hypothetical protein
MTKFESRFFRALNEQDEPSMDRQAMSASLDKGTDPEAFDVNPVASDDNSDVASGHLAAAAEADAVRHASDVKKMQNWLLQLTKINDYLVKPDSDSILSVIANAPEKTIIKTELNSADAIVTRAAKEITQLTTALTVALNKKNEPDNQGR